MAVITIKNLLLRTEVGFNKHEVGKLQDILLNIFIYFELQGEEKTDLPESSLNYRTICKEVINLVENDRFNLLERIADKVAEYILSIPRVKKVTIEVDKPNALRFSKSVSFTLSRSRD